MILFITLAVQYKKEDDIFIKRRPLSFLITSYEGDRGLPVFSISRGTVHHMILDIVRAHDFLDRVADIVEQNLTPGC
jgi:hypothetical protein